jgi:hypothetical protein
MAEITAARINNLQSSINLILGNGSGQNGYGQAVTSSQVNNTGDLVQAADLNAIYTDILKARIHQVGTSDIGIAEVVQNLNVVAENTSFYVDDNGVTSVDPDGIKKGLEDFEAVMSLVQTDKTIMHPTQAIYEDGISSVRSTAWNGLIYHEVVVTFASENARRFFFNTGGEIRFLANNTGASGAKGLDWGILCTEVGTVKFAANETTSILSGGDSGSGTSIGNYDLTGSYQNIYQKVGSGINTGIYAGNLYTIKARSVDVTSVTFRIEFNDISGPDANGGTIDNNVDGRIESIIKHYRSNGSVTVSAPTYNNTQALV